MYFNLEEVDVGKTIVGGSSSELADEEGAYRKEGKKTRHIKHSQKRDSSLLAICVWMRYSDSKAVRAFLTKKPPLWVRDQTESDSKTVKSKVMMTGYLTDCLSSDCIQSNSKSWKQLPHSPSTGSSHWSIISETVSDQTSLYFSLVVNTSFKKTSPSSFLTISMAIMATAERFYLP